MLPGTERPADRFVRARYYLYGSTRTDAAARGLASGAPTLRLVAEEGPTLTGQVWGDFVEAAPFTYLPERT